MAHPIHENVTPSSAQAILSTINTDNDRKQNVDIQDHPRDGFGGAAQDKKSTFPHPRTLIGVRGSVLPEKKGGLPKIGHVGVCYRQDVYVFGGVNNKGQFSNHVFCYQKQTLQWHEVRGVGVVPRGRANHAAVLIGNKIYVHGGHRNLEVFDDLFAYEIDTARWEKISCERSQGPGPTFLHSMVYIPSLESLFILGGIHQRELNNCLGHLFDIRNRIWTGVPPPSSVNAQHLQLVTATYHDPSAVVVVLGLMDADVMQESTMSTPHVHVFHPATFVWRRVDTSTAPMSPLPFRMESVWESLLHLLIPSGGGVYDPALESWMFPLPSTVMDNPEDDDAASERPPTADSGLPPLPLNKYGFLVLDLKTMSWSLVPCNLPRKLVAELNAVNRVMREKMEKLLIRNNTSPAALALSGVPSQSKSAVQQPGDSAAVLGMSSASLTLSPSGSSPRQSLVLRSQLLPLPPKESSSASVTWPRQSGSRPPAALGSNEAKTAALLSASRYRRLFFFDEAPEFMRKYTLVVLRAEPFKSGKVRPLDYLVLHGGLTGPSDYAMLMFSPILSQSNVNGAMPIGGTGLGAYSKSIRNRDIADGGIQTESSLTEKHSTEDDDYEEDSSDDVKSLVSNITSKTECSSQRSYRRTAPHPPPKEVKGLVDSRGAKYSDDDDYEMDTEEQSKNSGAAQKSFLLPTLQSGRTPQNYYRFALQFAPGNSIQKESLLPYPTIPVAVLQTPKDVQRWSRNYYADQRRWLSERIKEAMIEDRKLRRLRHLNKARQGQKATVSGTQGHGTLAGAAEQGDGSDSELDFRMSSLYQPEMGHDRRMQGGNTLSYLLSCEDELMRNSVHAASTHMEAPKRRLRDFFEQHGLDAFEEMDVQQYEMELRRAFGGNNAKLGPRRRDPKLKGRTLVPESVTTKASRKLESSQLTRNFPSSDGTMRSASELQGTDSGFERLRLKGWKDVGRERMAAGVCRDSTISGLTGGITGGSVDVRKLPAYMLLRRSIARLRGDSSPYEIHRRQAQLRWRYLRALVCTGDAADLLYLESQTDSKMKGIGVTGTQGLMLAPELCFLGPLQAHRVPCKPVPYNVSAGSTPALASSSRLAQVTASGMVVYHVLS